MCLIAVGTTNVEEVKAANSSWNSWLGEVMYTCPKGYVEAPGTFMEQSDPVTNDKDLKSFTIQCGDNAVWTPRPPHGGTSMPRCIPINCTEIPFPVENNDLGKYNWTGVQGIDPRPYATVIRYWYPRNGWGFPSNGEWEAYIYCEMDGYWSNLDTIEQCEKLSCPRRLVAGCWWLAALLPTLCRRRQWTQEPSLPHTGEWWGPTLETMGQTLHLSCHSTFHHMLRPYCALYLTVWAALLIISYLYSVQLET